MNILFRLNFHDQVNERLGDLNGSNEQNGFVDARVDVKFEINKILQKSQLSQVVKSMIFKVIKEAAIEFSFHRSNRS